VSRVGLLSSLREERANSASVAYWLVERPEWFARQTRCYLLRGFLPDSRYSHWTVERLLGLTGRGLGLSSGGGGGSSERMEDLLGAGLGL